MTMCNKVPADTAEERLSLAHQAISHTAQVTVILCCLNGVYFANVAVVLLS